MYHNSYYKFSLCSFRDGCLQQAATAIGKQAAASRYQPDIASLPDLQRAILPRCDQSVCAESICIFIHGDVCQVNIHNKKSTARMCTVTTDLTSGHHPAEIDHLQTRNIEKIVMSTCTQKIIHNAKVKSRTFSFQHVLNPKPRFPLALHVALGKHTLPFVSSGYWQWWQFPNYLGAVNGKHVHIKRPKKSGSLYYNFLR